jgi:hypothetical protein
MQRASSTRCPRAGPAGMAEHGLAVLAFQASLNRNARPASSSGANRVQRVRTGSAADPRRTRPKAMSGAGRQSRSALLQSGSPAAQPALTFKAAWVARRARRSQAQSPIRPGRDCSGERRLARLLDALGTVAMPGAANGSSTSGEVARQVQGARYGGLAWLPTKRMPHQAGRRTEAAKATLAGERRPGLGFS